MSWSVTLLIRLPCMQSIKPRHHESRVKGILKSKMWLCIFKIIPLEYSNTRVVPKPKGTTIAPHPRVPRVEIGQADSPLCRDGLTGLTRIDLFKESAICHHPRLNGSRRGNSIASRGRRRPAACRRGCERVDGMAHGTNTNVIASPQS